MANISPINGPGYVCINITFITGFRLGFLNNFTVVVYQLECFDYAQNNLFINYRQTLVKIMMFFKFGNSK
jgi:hypothetical protein